MKGAMRVIEVGHDEPWLLPGGFDDAAHRCSMKRDIASETRVRLVDYRIPVVVILPLVDVGDVVPVLLQHVWQRRADAFHFGETARHGLVAVAAR